MTALRNLQKRKIFDELLQQGITALHLDARRPDVTVPAHLAGQAWLVLNYSWRYGVHDFRFDDEAVEASLSFNGRPSFCRVPWSAVFAVTDPSRTQGYIWHDEVPGEVVPAAAAPKASKPKTPRAAKAKSAAPTDAATDTPAPAESPPPRPGLRAIPGGSDGTPNSPPRAGHLRRVK